MKCSFTSTVGTMLMFALVTLINVLFLIMSLSLWSICTTVNKSLANWWHAYEPDMEVNSL